MIQRFDVESMRSSFLFLTDENGTKTRTSFILDATEKSVVVLSHHACNIHCKKATKAMFGLFARTSPNYGQEIVLCTELSA